MLPRFNDPSKRANSILWILLYMNWCCFVTTENSGGILHKLCTLVPVHVGICFRIWDVPSVWTLDCCCSYSSSCTWTEKMLISVGSLRCFYWENSIVKYCKICLCDMGPDFSISFWHWVSGNPTCISVSSLYSQLELLRNGNLSSLWLCVINYRYLFTDTILNHLNKVIFNIAVTKVKCEIS